ncbi:MAG: DNA mismatch repair endonuclease MutL [Planctomycetota bacterium]|nr:DNA mismatch repair endonuclease MutL [Planctomycetota bacterium]
MSVYSGPVPQPVIQQLSPALVNRIAAGEAIERPASVVKELVENAIDAGAGHITIEIEDGGLSLIRIIDTGGGIPVDQLPLALASHATSKLQCDEDLFRISTMGFRGEALASIGAVSQMRLLSRTAEQAVAYEIFNKGGEITTPQAAGGNLGTVVEVRNLFYNVPARRKFMKGASTEFGHISEMLLRIALPYPTIGFQLMHNGKAVLDLPARSERERQLAAWPDEIAQTALAIDVRDAEIGLAGLVGLPEFAGPTAKHQYYFLNGRSIRDRIVQHALREAFRGLTEPGRQPAAILMLTMPPGDVDVNVHPTKAEVRFKNSGRIHSLVQSAIREKLMSSDLVPAATPTRFPAPLTDTTRQDMRAKLAEFFRSALPGGMESPANTQQATGTVPTFAQSSASLPVFRSIGTNPPSPSAPPQPPIAPSPAPATPAQPPSPQSFDAPTPPAIQLHNSYLVAESEDGLIIIDQHALHERIMYEDLLARISRGTLESQRLLIPITLPATPRQQDLLTQVQPLLQRLGIEVDAFGADTVAIHAFPSFLHRLDPQEFISDLLDRGEQEMLDLQQEELLHEVLDMMACKAAVKAGDPLTQQEIEALLARRHLIDRSSNCPHGRPTTLRLTLRDLEKQFKRTGF